MNRQLKLLDDSISIVEIYFTERRRLAAELKKDEADLTMHERREAGRRAIKKRNETQ